MNNDNSKKSNFLKLNLTSSSLNDQDENKTAPEILEELDQSFSQLSHIINAGNNSEAYPEKRINSNQNTKRIIFASLITFFLIFGISMIVIGNQNKKVNQNNNIESEINVNQTPEVKSQFIRKNQAAKFISYISDGNVWVTNTDGSNKINITKDGDIYSPYSNLTWKKKGVLGFTRCQNSDCTIYTYDLSTNKLNPELKIITPKITSLNWSNFSENPFYMYITSDGNEVASTYKDSTETIIHNWGKPTLESSKYLESKYFDFSPNGEFMLVYNQQSEKEKIVIFDLEFNKLGIIHSQSHSPFFVSQNEFVFSNEDKFYKSTVGSFFSELELEGYLLIEVKLSSSGKSILGWNEENKTQIIDSKLEKILVTIDNLRSSKWMSENEVVGISISNENIDFKINSLVKVNTSTNTRTIIEENNVTDFEIEKM